MTAGTASGFSSIQHGSARVRHRSIPWGRREAPGIVARRLHRLAARMRPGPFKSSRHEMPDSNSRS